MIWSTGIAGASVEIPGAVWLAAPAFGGAVGSGAVSCAASGSERNALASSAKAVTRVRALQIVNRRKYSRRTFSSHLLRRTLPCSVYELSGGARVVSRRRRFLNFKAEFQPWDVRAGGPALPRATAASASAWAPGIRSLFVAP